MSEGGTTAETLEEEPLHLAARPGDEVSASFVAAARTPVVKDPQAAPELNAAFHQAGPANLADKQEGRSVEIRPLGKAQAKLLQTIKVHEAAIFLGLMIAVYGFKSFLGGIALAHVLMGLTVLFLLTQSLRLNSFFRATADGSGITLVRQHWLGKEFLRLPWGKLESVSAECRGANAELRIETKKQVIGVVDSVVFEDLIVDGKIVLSSVESRDDFEEFLLFLRESCPANLLGKRPELPLAQYNEKGTQPKDNCLVVPYFHLRRYQKQFLSILKKTELILTILLSIAVFEAIFLLDARSVFSSLVCAAVLLIFLVLFLKDQLVSLCFDDTGISILWTAMGCTQRSKPIPWESVQLISLIPQAGCKAGKIEFHFCNSRPGTGHLAALRQVCYGLFRQQGNSIVLSLDLDGIDQQKSGHDLLTAISRFARAENVDRSVLDALNPTDTESYTRLWLDSLSTDGGQRRFEGQMEKGRCLRNGSFRIVDFLGAGGQASVYLAESTGEENDATDAQLGRPRKFVVLKEFILPSHAGADLSMRSLAHIQKEFDLMKRLHHENIVCYYDLFVEDHRCYLVLEHIPGKSLRVLVEEKGVLTQEEVLSLARQMSVILEHLHGQEPPVVHRDFTPENLILDDNGILKLIDFNVAQELEEESTGSIVGKHAYLPPEQFRGRACPQSDIYAMGATLYFLLTGEDPEPISCSHPIVKNESISAGLDALVARATEPELSERFRNACELRQGIDDLLDQSGADAG